MKTYKFIQAAGSGFTALFLMIALIAIIDNNLTVTNIPFLLVVGFVAVVLLLSSMFMALLFPLKRYEDEAHMDRVRSIYNAAEMKLAQATKIISDEISKKIVEDVIKEINSKK